ncbi:MAG: sucrose-specific PTS transporter subunit IIBC [Dermabacter sp.]|nr:sucrose-specific PTS transporter subunit IIBC [Dermabacter sp.]
MEHSQVAERVVRAVGGPDNIQAAAHCATRLRLVLGDDALVDQAALDNDPDIKGTFNGSGMYQIIIGPMDVDKVFSHLGAHGVKEMTKDELKEVASQKSNPVVRFLKVFADIFVPLIPVLVGGGMLMAFNNVLTAEGLFGEQSIVQMYPQFAGFAEIVNLLASAPFAFLPILVGFSATKRFGGNPYLGAAMGMAMVMPSLVNGYSVGEALSNGTMPYWDVFGIQVAQAGYQGSVLPILVISFVLAWVQKFFDRILKGTIGFIFTPTLTLLVVGFLTFMLVGPILFQGGELLGQGIQWLYETTWIFGGLIFGSVYSLIVITGLHQSFPPIEMTLWTTAAGGSFIFAIASMANVAQGAAALGVFLTTRDEKLKGIAGASSFSAFLGITEPAIFGVNLRLRWPLYIALAGGGLGGVLVALFNIKATALGAAGYLGFLSIAAESIPAFLASLVTVTVLVFVASYLVGRKKAAAHEEAERELAAARAAVPAAAGASLASGAAASTSASAPGSAAATGLAAEDEDHRLTAHLTGRLMDLSEVPDPTFAGGMLGGGAAIEPTEGVLYAPADAEVTVAFPTAHAVGLRTAGGIEVLAHIGLDTVNLNGQHFVSRVEAGQIVKRGDVLVEFDIDAIRAAGYSLATPLVVTNEKAIGTVALADGAQSGQSVSGGGDFLTVTPK